MENNIVPVELIRKMVTYIEKAEVIFDREFGDAKELTGLIAANQMPKFYFDLVDLIVFENQDA
jgi:hypothetical protein